jgi:hypothetical protein
MDGIGPDVTRWVAVAAVAIAVAGCGGSSPVKGCTDPTAVNFDPAAAQDDGSCLAFQGPRDPDFEISESWTQDPSNGRAGNGFASMVSGTGFMPTHGLKYLALLTGTTNNWYTGTTTIFQDGVSLARSTTLVLDYSATGTGSVTLEILFTGNGTATLWTKTFSAAVWSLFDVQKLGETVTLPALPDRGRLTIKLSATGGQDTWGDVRIDNIRVN